MGASRGGRNPSSLYHVGAGAFRSARDLLGAVRGRPAGFQRPMLESCADLFMSFTSFLRRKPERRAFFAAFLNAFT